jgi:hypothetical protein
MNKQAMVELLDPAGQYFGQRVIAQAPAAEDAPGDAAIVVKRLTAVRHSAAQCSGIVQHSAVHSAVQCSTVHSA